MATAKYQISFPITKEEREQYELLKKEMKISHHGIYKKGLLAIKQDQ